MGQDREPGTDRDEERPDGGRADPRGHRESAANLSGQAAEEVGRGYDPTADAFVHEQRRQGKADEDEDVAPG